MRCPFCQFSIKPTAPECPECRLTFPRASALLGALPRLSPVMADTTHTVNPRDMKKIKRMILTMERHFPELVVQVVMHRFPQEHPFAMHVFWLFNAGAFAGEGRRGKRNHSLLLAVDPDRGESAIIPGYGLEFLLKTEALDHLLELAGPAWADQRWADGIMRVLDGIDQLLETVAVASEAKVLGEGEF